MIKWRIRSFGCALFYKLTCLLLLKFIKKLKNTFWRVINVAYLTLYLYLCTRKSAYCAGSIAINTLIKSNLAFKNEAVEVPF